MEFTIYLDDKVSLKKKYYVSAEAHKDEGVISLYCGLDQDYDNNSYVTLTKEQLIAFINKLTELKSFM